MLIAIAEKVLCAFCACGCRKTLLVCKVRMCYSLDSHSRDPASTERNQSYTRGPGIDQDECNPERHRVERITKPIYKV